MFVATINGPGYQPMDDDPPLFGTALEAWQYLKNERARLEREEWFLWQREYSQTDHCLWREVNRCEQVGHVCSEECCGTIDGPIPGTDSDDDPSLVYSVSYTFDTP